MSALGLACLERPPPTPSHSSNTLLILSSPHNTHQGPLPHPLSSGLSFWKAQRHLLCHGDRAISRPEQEGGVCGG